MSRTLIGVLIDETFPVAGLSMVGWFLSNIAVMRQGLCFCFLVMMEYSRNVWGENKGLRFVPVGSPSAVPGLGLLQAARVQEDILSCALDADTWNQGMGRRRIGGSSVCVSLFRIQL